MKYVTFENNFIRTPKDMDKNNKNVFESITIDGYPAAENGEGTIICEVYITIHGDIVVSWMEREYKNTPAVKDLLNKSIAKLINDFTKEQGVTVYNMCLNFELKLGLKEINDITAACGFSEKLVSSITIQMKQTITFIPTEEAIQEYEKTIKENYKSDKFTCESCQFTGYEYLLQKQIKTDA